MNDDWENVTDYASESGSKRWKSKKRQLVADNRDLNGGKVCCHLCGEKGIGKRGGWQLCHPMYPYQYPTPVWVFYCCTYIAHKRCHERWHKVVGYGEGWANAGLWVVAPDPGEVDYGEGDKQAREDTIAAPAWNYAKLSLLELYSRYEKTAVSIAKYFWWKTGDDYLSDEDYIQQAKLILWQKLQDVDGKKTDKEIRAYINISIRGYMLRWLEVLNRKLITSSTGSGSLDTEDRDVVPVDCLMNLAECCYHMVLEKKRGALLQQIEEGGRKPVTERQFKEALSNWTKET